MSEQIPFDREVDVLVIGSGAGAMTAALVAHLENCGEVLVVEKGGYYGGTSAMSGGALWIPNSHLARAAGANDSPEDALLHLREITNGEVADERLRAYVDKAPEMLEYMMDKTHLDYELMHDADYYPEAPGGKHDFRVHQGRPMNAKYLGKCFKKLHEQPPQVLVMNLLPLTLTEARTVLKRSKGWMLTTMKIMLRYVFDIPGRLKGMRSRYLTMGNALVGQLRRSMLDEGIELWLDSPMQSLIENNGTVTGAVIEKEGKQLRIRARKGVVIGTGGFEHNQQMREQYLPKPTSTEWSASQTNNTGDGIRAAMTVGAKTDMMQHAWWAPVVRVPDKPRPYAIFSERCMPGMVIVNKAGKRFHNEASPYGDAVQAMYERNDISAATVPAYLVFGAKFRKNYAFGPLLPGYMMPDLFLFGWIKELLKKAKNIETLAKKIDVNVENLQETISKNNDYAHSGTDTEFQRGTSFFDRYNSDGRAHPNPCIGTISKAPYYSLPLHPGDLGTKGGILTDENARALNENGEPIQGLYVIGNASASIMGGKDPGSGATLGPSMTFGYLAALNMARQ